jgi:hypothetical protein
MLHYLASDFFAASYFGGVDPIHAAGSPAMAPGVSDREAFDAIVGVLTASGEFADVLFGRAPCAAIITAAAHPLAVVIPDRWSETVDIDPDHRIRSASYRLLLAVRDGEPRAGYRHLDRLACLAQNLLDQTDLGGRTLAALTRLDRGRPMSSSFPEQWMLLRGEFAYRFARADGRNATS